jgi:hypothetical protein
MDGRKNIKKSDLKESLGKKGPADQIQQNGEF